MHDERVDWWAWKSEIEELGFTLKAALGKETTRNTNWKPGQILDWGKSDISCWRGANCSDFEEIEVEIARWIAH